MGVTPMPTAVKQYVDPHPTGGRHNNTDPRHSKLKEI